MAFSRQTVAQSLAYWYERFPLTSRVQLGAGASAPVIPQTGGWNQSNAAPVGLVTLESVATPRDPALTLRLTADGVIQTLYAGQHPPRLGPVPVGARAIRSIALTALNTTTSAMVVPDPVLAQVSVFRMPAVLKVMLGYSLTDEENTILGQLGIDTSPLTMNGQFPIPLSAVIERTYLNRRVGSPIAYDGPPIDLSAGSRSLPTLEVPDNQILVLTGVAAEVSSDYGPQVSIAKDNVDNYLTFDPSLGSMDRPLDMFLVAKDQFTITLTTSTPPPAPVPVRVTAIPISLSNILRIRLGMLSAAGLAQIFQADVAQQLSRQGKTATPQDLAAAAADAQRFYNRVQAGVM
jgi:hypothetical protein